MLPDSTGEFGSGRDYQNPYLVKRPVFVLRRGDRLIARLKLLLNMWRFADQINARTIMVWQDVPKIAIPYDGDQYAPSLIFDLETFYARGESDSLVFLEGRHYFDDRVAMRTFDAAEFAACRDDKFKRSDFEGRCDVFFAREAHPFFFDDEPKGWSYRSGSLRALFARLPPSPEVARVVEGSTARMGTEGFVAMHVRRGDVDDMLRRELPGLADGSLSLARLQLIIGHFVSRIGLFETYYDDIEQAIAGGEKVLFFSDTPETLAHFEDRYGKRHFVDMNVRTARLPIQQAYADFLTLTKARKVVSSGSNYARFAATLGGATSVNVADRGNVERQEAYLYETYLAGTRLDAPKRTLLRKYLEIIASRRKTTRPMAPLKPPSK